MIFSFHGTLLPGRWAGKYLIQGKGMGIEYKCTHDGTFKRKIWASWTYKKKKNKNRNNILVIEVFLCCFRLVPWSRQNCPELPAMFGSCLRQTGTLFALFHHFLHSSVSSGPIGHEGEGGVKKGSKEGRFNRTIRNMTYRKRLWKRFRICRYQTPDSRLQTSDSRLYTPDFVYSLLLINDIGWSLESGVWSLEFEVSRSESRV